MVVGVEGEEEEAMAAGEREREGGSVVEREKGGREKKAG